VAGVKFWLFPLTLIVILTTLALSCDCVIHGTPLERLSVYKLFGVFISADLRWETHTEYIISKAAKRLYFLKQLKRAGLSSSRLLHFYTAVIRLVLTVRIGLCLTAMAPYFYQISN